MRSKQRRKFLFRSLNIIISISIGKVVKNAHNPIEQLTCFLKCNNRIIKSWRSILIGDLLNFGKLLALNETAAWLWKEAEAQSSFTVDSLADKLCEEYDVTAEQAHQDVADIVRKWQEVEVIE